jgi:serine/threonine protein kinase
MLNTKIKEYHIQSEIGRGGMATVYWAEHQLLHSKVAVKVLNKEFAHNENIRKRFLAEARNMFKMSHPNIIKVTDLIEEGDTVAFVMEYVEGESLKEYMERKGKLRDAEIKTIFSQMLDAVGYVHEQNLVHRDIKPSNFMLDKKGKVKLMDFGIAKNTDSNSAEYTQTGTGMQMGTPMYMSPEQITETKSVTAQSDIYSLGVVLWQMVTGQKPYDTKTLSNFQLQMKIVNEPLQSTGSQWDGIIQRACAKNRSERFTNCGIWLSEIKKPSISNFSSSLDDKQTIIVNETKENAAEKKRLMKSIKEINTEIVNNKTGNKQENRDRSKNTRSSEQTSSNLPKSIKRKIVLIAGLAVGVFLLFFSTQLNHFTSPAVSPSTSVRVNLTYPSDYIPDMHVTLLNLDTRKKIVQRSSTNVNYVKFNNVPTGDYVVYAVTVDNLVYPEKGLGMPDTEAPLIQAQGGYTANAFEYYLLPFAVELNSTITVEINNWDVNIP